VAAKIHKKGETIRSPLLKNVNLYKISHLREPTLQKTRRKDKVLLIQQLADYHPGESLLLKLLLHFNDKLVHIGLDAVVVHV
jgi:hypothetical protein